MKKILIIGATHGDEKIGLEVNKVLRKNGLNKYYDFIIGNPAAEKVDKRFIDKDLNRVYPGKQVTDCYEEKRAWEILQLTKKYEFVIDFHEAKEGTEDFVIVSKNRLPLDFPLKLINLEKILLWPEPKGPLGEVVENEIELEFGMEKRNREESIKKGVDIIKSFINSVYNNKKEINRKIIIYQVYGFLKADKCEKSRKKFKDFQLSKFNGESFYPLLVDQYSELGIKCYKMRKFI